MEGAVPGESTRTVEARFFDRALRTMKEYNDKIDYIHLNPVEAGPAVGGRKASTLAIAAGD